VSLEARKPRIEVPEKQMESRKAMEGQRGHENLGEA